MKYKKTVAIMTGRIITEIGPSQIWIDFFDSIDQNFADAAKRFPVLKKMFNKGKVKAKDAQQAKAEMTEIRNAFEKLFRSNGEKLSNSFITSTKRNLIDELFDSFDFCINERYDTKVVSYDEVAETALF